MRVVAREDISLSDLIKTARKNKNWRLIELSAKVSLTPGYISKIEQGHAKFPSDAILYRLANALGLDILQLIELRDKDRSKKANAEPPSKSIPDNGEQAPEPFSPLMPPLHDAVGPLMQIKNAPAFYREYQALAEAYSNIGHVCCTVPAEDGSLNYRSGLAAYQAAAAIYAQAELTSPLNQLRYKMARVYQNLVMTDRIRSDERLIFLYRAGELLDQVYVADISPNQAGKGLVYSASRLKSASLAVGATICKLIAVELESQIQHTGLIPERQHPLQIEIDALYSASNVRRIQADLLYSKTVEELWSEHRRLKKRQDEWRSLASVLFNLAETMHLQAINWRGKEVGRRSRLSKAPAISDDDNALKGLERSLTLFRNATRIQLACVRLISKCAISDVKEQARQRRQLARVHEEWGITFSYSERNDAFAQTQWQFAVANEVCSSEWIPLLSDQDRYIAGDQYLPEYIKRITDEALAEGGNPRNAAHVADIAIVGRIMEEILNLRNASAFQNLKYPLTYTLG